MTRPSLEEVYAYRAAVDDAMERFLERSEGVMAPAVAAVVELGLNHEQQHQELIVTDIKYTLDRNPLRPAYREDAAIAGVGGGRPLEWLEFPGGLDWIGHEGDGFCFDNEAPRHRAYLEGFELASRPVTSGEYLEFMGDRGYRRPELWLSDGWNVAMARDWSAPLYWEERDGEWWTMTLGGFRAVSPSEPVCHVSYYEADAYARWAGARLPSEAEW
jgi:ergothioneine biosynthesis protein EgtB